MQFDHAVRGQVDLLDLEIFDRRQVARCHLDRIGIQEKEDKTDDQDNRDDQEKPGIGLSGEFFVGHDPPPTSKLPIHPSSANSLWCAWNM